MLKGKGFTLIELMVLISVLSILMAIAIPNLNNFIIKMRVDNEITSLHRLLLVARNFAINSGQNVTLCPLNDSLQCSTDWHLELSVFRDSNNNASLDANSNEVILKVKPAITGEDKLLYGKGRAKIIYKPTGQLSGLSNGTFRYCPTNNLKYARGIVIARSGRLYQTTDVDNDGYNENRSNAKLNCN